MNTEPFKLSLFGVFTVHIALQVDFFSFARGPGFEPGPLPEKMVSLHMDVYH